MAGTEATLYEVKDGAAWITLNRPENRNALSAVLVNELYEHLQEANEDTEARCIIITGTGPAFCAGADLKSPPGQSIEGTKRSVPYPDVLTTIQDSPKPVIAAVNGAAFAGGLGLVVLFVAIAQPSRAARPRYSVGATLACAAAGPCRRAIQCRGTSSCQKNEIS